MVKSILIATTNAGKVREILRILDGLPHELKTLADFPGIPVPEETGATFAENASQKARHYAGLTGMVTMAEDSGFEVDALNGDPGIFSARYLREDATVRRALRGHLSSRARRPHRESSRAICLRARRGPG